MLSPQSAAPKQASYHPTINWKISSDHRQQLPMMEKDFLPEKSQAICARTPQVAAKRRRVGIRHGWLCSRDGDPRWPRSFAPISASRTAKVSI